MMMWSDRREAHRAALPDRRGHAEGILKATTAMPREAPGR